MTIREAIIAHIKQRLGPDLAGVYSDAIASSVSLGIYDDEWTREGEDHPKIEKYASGLLAHWLEQHAGQQHLLQRLLLKLEYGSDAEKHQLKQILAIGE